MQEQWRLSGTLLEFAEDGDYALVRQIINVFLTDTQVKMESLEAGVFPTDFADVRRIAHSLKGAAKQVGTPRLAEDAGRLEKCDPETDAATFHLLVTAVAESWDEARRSINDTLTRMP